LRDFPLGLALILISRMLPETADVKSDNWRLPVFPGCPAWMNYMTRGFYIYALMNFAVFFLMNLVSTGTPTLSMSQSLGAGDPSIASWRGFSSMWMAQYSFGLAIITSACRAGKSTNGYGMAVGAKFCSESCSMCGAPANENSNRKNSCSCRADSNG
jgi:hypothetical protein